MAAAHSDRREGKTALVVVQTSNEQLDGLNARAQALRAQDGDLGEQEVEASWERAQLDAASARLAYVS
ncbi:MAG: hypothetical protein M3Y17_00990 [Actinomycetota bacterium]|nr:hypothetical protein [Actinomycetota bacterium]